jgi:phage terminase small subunit
VLQGTFRRDRHGGFETPEPPKGQPVSPKKLAGDAALEWDRMVTRLEKAGSLSIVDDAALYQYVLLFAETEDLKAESKNLRELFAGLKRQALKKLDGAELVEAIGKIVQLQALAAKQRMQLRQQRMAIRQYLVEFGLTPVARSRVKLSLAKTPVVDAKKERFFGRGGHP